MKRVMADVDLQGWCPSYEEKAKMCPGTMFFMDYMGFVRLEEALDSG